MKNKNKPVSFKKNLAENGEEKEVEHSRKYMGHSKNNLEGFTAVKREKHRRKKIKPELLDGVDANEVEQETEYYDSESDD